MAWAKVEKAKRYTRCRRCWPRAHALGCLRSGSGHEVEQQCLACLDSAHELERHRSCCSTREAVPCFDSPCGASPPSGSDWDHGRPRSWGLARGPA